MSPFAEHLAQSTKARLRTVQDYFALAGRALGFIFARPFYGQDVIQQMDEIGVKSLGIVLLTGFFTGMVLALQSSVQLQTFGATMYIGRLVSASMIRELGPVLAGLMVAGRVGASMAADIGTMKVTEQVDALRVMGVHPVDYLVLPRFIAMMISMPMLIAESITFGLLASALVCIVGYDMPSPWFWTHTMEHTNFQDLGIGMIKGFVFGILITLISCHQGLIAENGAVGVGIGTTRAVVISSLALLIFNFFLSILLNYAFPLGTGV